MHEALHGLFDPLAGWHRGGPSLQAISWVLDRQINVFHLESVQGIETILHKVGFGEREKKKKEKHRINVKDDKLAGGGSCLQVDLLVKQDGTIN